MRKPVSVHTLAWVYQETVALRRHPHAGPGSVRSVRGIRLSRCLYPDDGGWLVCSLALLCCRVWTWLEGPWESDQGNNTDPGSSLHVLWPWPWGRAGEGGEGGAFLRRRAV